LGTITQAVVISDQLAQSIGKFIVHSIILITTKVVGRAKGREPVPMEKIDFSRIWLKEWITSEQL
jgi:hypothetical protein